MVDPLDGTKNFINKGDGFAVMIGLCVNGVPEIGVVYAPLKDKLYYSQKDAGAYEEVSGKKIRLKTGKMSNLDDIRLVVRDTYGESKPEQRDFDKIVDGLKVKEKIPEGSVGLKLGLIASNKADANIMTNPRGSKWDTCAPQIILEEAGGVVTDLFEKPLKYKQDSLRWENLFVASSNKILHGKLIKKLKAMENES